MKNGREIALPLTEGRGEGGEGEGGRGVSAGGVTEGQIAAVVEDFYAACRADPVLGPVFGARIQDWPEHLAHIRAFWGAALLKRGGFSGRPVEAHRAVPGLSGEHMAVWLRLFAVAVRRHCSPAGSAEFLRLAGRMGSRIMGSLGEGRG